MGETRSPISKLHVELLWTIFLASTEALHGIVETDLAWLEDEPVETQGRPLTVIRRSSQVCRKWRDIILGSPSLWGKLLDMSLLSELARGHWMNEVVRRSGRSPLYITTDSVGISKRLAPLVTLLDDHWERVQVLNVILKVGGSTDIIGTEISQILRRPAPCLRSFKVDFISDTGGSPAFSPEPPLFGNAAPALVALCCPHSFLTQGSPNLWLSQLRVLHMSLDTCRPYNVWVYDVSPVLQTFREIPGLEILMLSGRPSPPRPIFTTSPHKPVALPKLKVLRVLIDSNTTMTEILDTLVVPDACGLAVSVKHEPGQFVQGRLTHTYQALHRYSQNYFNTHTITALQLSVSSNGVLLQDVSVNCGISGFSLDIHSDAAFSSGELSLIFDLLADANLGGTTYITLDIGPFDNHLSESNFMSLLRRLDSVEALATAEPVTTLQFLLDNMKGVPPLIFPMLETLIFTAMPSVSISSGPLLPFLKWRKDEDSLIDRIDLRHLYYDSSPQDLDLLEEMTGLLITWDASTASDDEELICEYLCGNGHPEMLRDIFPIDNTSSDLE
ncbi:hypothetical protein GALMADRAFT_146222 [Galerina marginata CBS 339.88]|uniref:F-box domain-containing protein n=1 Tax=Galerina marginata (strain CBS 339.88) TaxID=685588 RepID=A0A067SP74_GALM3|nr:hypothetical protein GALMADRAFT_146222 [Galerina marginata CBS 339.88]